MRPSPKRGFLAVLLAGTLLAGCATAATEGGGGGNAQTLVVAQSSDILSLDPSLDTSPISLNVFKAVYDQLTEITAEGDVGPQLATDWSVSDDAMQWTFRLRTDATFHNGDPVTADDVVWTYQKIMDDAASPVRPYLAEVESVSKVDDATVRFDMRQPFAFFDRQVSLISVLPKAYFTQVGAAAFARDPVGSGPFELVSWVKDSQVRLRANADYWGGAPRIQELVFRPVPEESSREAGLVAGDLDIAPVLPPSSVEHLGSTPGIRVETVRSNRVHYLGFNTTRPPLDEVKLRRAVDAAIDREAITEALLDGLGVPSGQLAAPVTFGYADGIAPTPYDPAKARRLLEESGYDGEPIPFQYANNRYPFGEQIAQAVAGYLEEVGIRVDMEGMDYSAFFPRWASNNLEGIHLFAFGPSIMDADLPLQSLYVSGSRGYWTDDTVDRLITQQRAETDPAARERLIAEVWRISQREVPYAILHNEIQVYGVSDRVRWEPRPDERLLFDDAELTGG